MNNLNIKTTELFDVVKKDETSHSLEECWNTDSSLDGYVLKETEQYKKILREGSIDDDTIEYVASLLEDENTTAVDMLDTIGFTGDFKTVTELLIKECGNIDEFKNKYDIDNSTSDLLDELDLEGLLEEEEEPELIEYKEPENEVDDSLLLDFEEEELELEEPVEIVVEEIPEIVIDEEDTVSDLDDVINPEETTIPKEEYKELLDEIESLKKENQKILAIVTEVLINTVGEEAAKEIIDPFSDDENLTREELETMLIMVQDKTHFPETLANLYLELYDAGDIGEVSDCILSYIDSCMELGVKF